MEEYFLPKIGGKVKIFSLCRKNNILNWLRKGLKKNELTFRTFENMETQSKFAESSTFLSVQSWLSFKSQEQRLKFTLGTLRSGDSFSGENFAFFSIFTAIIPAHLLCHLMWANSTGVEFLGTIPWKVKSGTFMSKHAVTAHITKTGILERGTNTRNGKMKNRNKT